MTGLVADDVVNAVGRFFRAVDTRDWDTVVALLADTVATDCTSVFDGEPETLTGAALTTRWRGLLPGFDATQHFLGPLLSTAADTVACNVRAHHALDGDVWMVAGWYQLTVTRGDGPEPVRITGIVIAKSYETGPRELVERAQRRAA